MPWDTNNYPDSMNNLDESTRNKAVEIANALLEEGMNKGKAIAIATKKAKEWKKNHS